MGLLNISFTYFILLLKPKPGNLYNNSSYKTIYTIMIFWLFLPIFGYSSNIVSYTISLSSYQICEKSNYNISFTPINPVPTGGAIQLIFPSYFESIATSNPICTAILSIAGTCSIVSNILYLNLSSVLTSPGVFTINNVANPSPAIPMTFVCNTLDTNYDIIDSFNATVSYTPKNIQNCSIVSSSPYSGVLAS